MKLKKYCQAIVLFFFAFLSGAIQVQAGDYPFPAATLAPDEAAAGTGVPIGIQRLLARMTSRQDHRTREAEKFGLILPSRRQTPRAVPPAEISTPSAPEIRHRETVLDVSPQPLVVSPSPISTTNQRGKLEDILAYFQSRRSYREMEAKARGLSLPGTEVSELLSSSPQESPDSQAPSQAGIQAASEQPPIEARFKRLLASREKRVREARKANFLLPSLSAKEKTGNEVAVTPGLETEPSPIRVSSLYPPPPINETGKATVPSATLSRTTENESETSAEVNQAIPGKTPPLKLSSNAASENTEALEMSWTQPSKVLRLPEAHFNRVKNPVLEIPPETEVR